MVKDYSSPGFELAIVLVAFAVVVLKRKIFKKPNEKKIKKKETKSCFFFMG